LTLAGYLSTAAVIASLRLDDANKEGLKQLSFRWSDRATRGLVSGYNSGKFQELTVAAKKGGKMYDLESSSKKKLLSLAGMLLLLSLNTTPATAGGASYNVFVTMVDARSDGNFTVLISEGTTGGPACASSSSTQLTGTTNTAAGRAILAVAMAAFLSGKKIGMEGNGTCSEYLGYETVGRIAAVNN